MHKCLFPDEHTDGIKSYPAAFLQQSWAGAPVDCESEDHVAVIAGTTAAILRSLFGQLHKEALTSPAQVDPDSRHSQTLTFSQLN